MAWTATDGMACYDGSAPNITLFQNDVFIVGNIYFVKFTISGMTGGALQVVGLENTHEYTSDGSYTIIDKAILTTLSFNPIEFSGDVFDGCIDDVESNEIPYYLIKDLAGNVVFEMTDTTGVTADRSYVQYQIDWTEIEEGCYYIEIPGPVLTYRSSCFALKLLHGCSILLEWTNDQDAYGFDYSGLSFTPSLRIDGKLWKPAYPRVDKETYDYSDGSSDVTYVRVYKERKLTIADAPEYIHDAIAIGIDHDSFYVDNVKSFFPDEEYAPAWRNSSDTAPAEIVVRQSQQDLLNANC